MRSWLQAGDSEGKRIPGPGDCIEGSSRRGLGMVQETKHRQSGGAPQAGRRGGRWAVRAAGAIPAGPCGNGQEFGLYLKGRGSHQSV